METLRTLGSRIRTLFTPRSRSPRSPRTQNSGKYIWVENVGQLVKGQKYSLYSKGYGLGCGSDWDSEYLGLTDKGECKFQLTKHPRINTVGKNKVNDFLVYLPPVALHDVDHTGRVRDLCKVNEKKDGHYYWSARGFVKEDLLSPGANYNDYGVRVRNTRKMRKSRKTRKIRKD
jgi:hypothetical protein